MGADCIVHDPDDVEVVVTSQENGEIIGALVIPRTKVDKGDGLNIEVRGTYRR